MDQGSRAAAGEGGGARRRSPARCARGVLLLLGSLLLAWTSVGCYVSRSIIFPGSPTALPAPGAALDSGVRVVGYRSEDGVELRGLLVAGAGEGPRPALVYFHGNAESAADNLDVARALAAEGPDVLVAEYRGYGGCPGSPCEEGLVADGRAAIDAAARELGRPAAELVLVGRSLGTGVVARLLAEGHGAGAALISPYTSIYEVACAIAPRPLVWLAVHDRFDSLAHLRGWSRSPLLVIHGDEDEVIPFAMGEELARAAGARFIPLRGVGHNDLFLRSGRLVAREIAAHVRAAHAR